MSHGAWLFFVTLSNRANSARSSELVKEPTAEAEQPKPYFAS
jgi:hypothetical protein